MDSDDTLSVMTKPASFLDFSMGVVSSPSRPQDFVIIQHFINPTFTPASLNNGAHRAAQIWPQTKSYLHKYFWIEKQNWTPIIKIQEVRDEIDGQKILDQFLAQSIDLKKETPVQQILIQEPNKKSILATRMHHAVGDLLSASMWLRCQLDLLDETPQPLTLKTQKERVQKSQFSPPGASAALWAQSNKKSSHRKWDSLILDSASFRSTAQKDGRFTYNDILCTATLEAARNWNLRYMGTDKNISVWLPVNIRSIPFNGFGNGTSRIRIYSDKKNISFSDKCAHTREQVIWSKKNGEWVIPNLDKMYKIPSFIAKWILNAYFNRPGVDMGTVMFSHAERLTDTNENSFGQGFQYMDVIANLHSHYPLAIAATSDLHHTRLTFTYDPAALSPIHVQEFQALFQDALMSLK